MWKSRTKIVREGSTATRFLPEDSMMRDAAGSLDFGKAIALREQIKKLNERMRGSKNQFQDFIPKRPLNERMI